MTDYEKELSKEWLEMLDKSRILSEFKEFVEAVIDHRESHAFGGTIFMGGDGGRRRKAIQKAAEFLKQRGYKPHNWNG